MSIIKGIPLVEKGSDIERDEFHETAQTARAVQEVKQARPMEANDPIISEAIQAIKQVSENLGRKIDVEYEPEAGLAVFTVYTSDGETVVRKVPPEELIRMAERMKDRRAQYLDEIF